MSVASISAALTLGFGLLVNAALRTKQYVTFDEEHQEVLAGGKVFKF